VVRFFPRHSTPHARRSALARDGVLKTAPAGKPCCYGVRFFPRHGAPHARRSALARDGVRSPAHPALTHRSRGQARSYRVMRRATFPYTPRPCGDHVSCRSELARDNVMSVMSTVPDTPLSRASSLYRFFAKRLSGVMHQPPHGQTPKILQRERHGTPRACRSALARDGVLKIAPAGKPCCYGYVVGPIWVMRGARSPGTPRR